MIHVHSDSRYSLATLAGKTITDLAHADDLGDFLPRINQGGAFALIDRDPDARGDDLPFLEGRVIAMFTQAAPVQVTTGRASGVGRGGNGQFRTNYATRELVAPLDLAGLEAIIARCQAQLREVA
jgi:hypothetical protein